MKKLFSFLLLFGLATLLVAPFVAGESPDKVVLTQEVVGISVLIVALASIVAPKKKAGYSYVMAIQDARSVLTSASIGKYIETVPVMSFLRSFFPPIEKMTLKISIEVQRGTEKLAVDVLRGTKGNLNKKTLSTEKQFEPPYFYERFVMNDTDLYNVAIATESAAAFAQLADEQATTLVECRNKIERRYEYMCSQVLETGIVTLVNGDNIDFKRKADSKVDLGAGNYWADAGVNPFTSLATACKFIREKGKSTGVYYNAIFGESALADLINNPNYKDRNMMVNSPLDAVHGPIRDSSGGTLHGELTCGSYKVRVWTYTEVYDDPITGESAPYIKDDLVIVLPNVTKFNLVFAAVPQLIKNGQVPQKGAYLITDFVNEDDEFHEMRVKSAGVPIPTAVDQIYTMKVVETVA